MTLPSFGEYAITKEVDRKMMIKKIILFFNIGFILSPHMSLAQSLTDKAISNNLAISRWLDEMATELDLFLVGKRVTDRKNETNIKIDNSTYIEEHKQLNNTTSFNLNLRLPNWEDYWQLKFTSYDESEERRGIQRGPLRKTPRERNYGASVGFFRQLGDVATSFQPRIDLGSRLKVSHSLGFDTKIDQKTYELVPKLEFYAKAEQGTGIYHSFNINIPLNEIFAISFINNAEYEDKKHNFTVANGFAVAHGITERSSFAYSLIFGSNNRENYHLEDYTLSVTWSHVVYKKILDYQIIPYLGFPRTRSFKATPGITFNVGLMF